MLTATIDEKENEEFQADHELDTCGLFCPEPVMMLHNMIRDMKPGEVVKVLATDPSTQRDIPKFCIYLNHPLIAQSNEKNHYIYMIQKRH